MKMRLTQLIGLLLSTSIRPLSAQEEILSYHSDIDILADASMVVTETITVRSEGNRIQRGIFRDFPTSYEDRFGNAYRVGFQPMSVSRDGNPEPWRMEPRANGFRIYIGDANSLMANGVHRYQSRIPMIHSHWKSMRPQQFSQMLFYHFQSLQSAILQHFPLRQSPACPSDY